MQFNYLFYASLLNSVMAIATADDVTYVDVTVTPKATKSVVATVTSTSTPFITTTLSEAKTTDVSSHSVKKSSTAKKALSSSSNNVTTSVATQLELYSKTTTITSCPPTASVSEFLENVAIQNKPIVNMALIAAMALL